MTNEEAYRILTRDWTNMHHTERTVLDTHPDYQKMMDAVKAGDRQTAITLALNVRTPAGRKWRAEGKHLILRGIY